MASLIALPSAPFPFATERSLLSTLLSSEIVIMPIVNTYKNYIFKCIVYIRICVVKQIYKLRLCRLDWVKMIDNEAVLYYATLLQYRQRARDQPYLSPNELNAKGNIPEGTVFEAAELAELIYQMRQVKWDGFLTHASRFTEKPAKLYDFVKSHKIAMDAKATPVPSSLEVAAEE